MGTADDADENKGMDQSGQATASAVAAAFEILRRRGRRADPRSTFSQTMDGTAFAGGIARRRQLGSDKDVAAKTIEDAKDAGRGMLEAKGVAVDDVAGVAAVGLELREAAQLELQLEGGADGGRGSA
jgi:hypothetical protein